jgi:hypothetical protein
MIAQSIAIKGLGCRPGRWAGKAVALTSGGLHRVSSGRLRKPRGDLSAMQKAAEGRVDQAVGKAREAPADERAGNR